MESSIYEKWMYEFGVWINFFGFKNFFFDIWIGIIFFLMVDEMLKNNEEFFSREKQVTMYLFFVRLGYDFFFN